MAKTSTNDIFDKTSFLHGSNAAYIEQMYEKYQTDPSQIPEDWKIFFSGLSKNLNEQNILRASWSNNDFPTEEDLAININSCLLYTSPSPRDRTRSRMPSSA